MTELIEAPKLLLGFLLLLVGSGSALTIHGRKQGKRTPWAAGLLFFFFLAALLYSAHAISIDGAAARMLLRGWIWDKESDGAALAGILVDPMSVTLLSLLVLISTAALFLPRAEKTVGALVLCVAGAAACWLSATPWMAIIGLFLAALGGFLSESDSDGGGRGFWQRTIGILLIALGTCGISGFRPPLVWLGAIEGQALPWMQPGAREAIASGLGSLFVVLGLFLQFDWRLDDPGDKKEDTKETGLAARLIPFFATIGVFFRYQEILGAPRVLAILGDALLAVSALSSLYGGALPADRCGSVFRAWLFSGMALCGAAVCKGEPIAGISVMIGLLVSSSAFGARIESGNARSKRINRAKSVLILIAGGSAACLPGFVSWLGLIHWLDDLKGSFLFWWVSLGFFFFLALGWKLIFSLVRPVLVSSPPSEQRQDIGPFGIFSGLLGLGVVWCGLLSGGALPGGSDRVFPSLYHFMWPETPETYGSAMAMVSAVSAGQLLSVGLGFALARKLKINAQRPAMRFILSGYGLSSAFSALARGVRRVSAAASHVMDERINARTVPWALMSAARSAGEAAGWVDRVLSEGLGSWIVRGVDVPAKFLQLVQNGDIQWYLIFALGAVLSVVVHYLIGIVSVAGIGEILRF